MVLDSKEDTSLFSLEKNQIWKPLTKVNHRDDEYDESGFDLLRNMQENHFWYKGRHRFLCEAFRRITKVQFKDHNLARSALDLGGGCGGWVKYFSETEFGNSWNLGLADSSVKALEFSTECLPDHVSKYQVDLMNLPWENRWDVVFLLDVLEHIPNDAKAMEQIQKCLKPGGLLFVTTPALQRLWSYNDELVHHVRRYSRPDFATLADKTNFELVRSRYFMFFLSPLLILSRLFGPDISQLTEAERGQLLKSTHKIPHPLVNNLFSLIFSTETPIGHMISFPWGTSILGVFRKPLT